MNELSLTLDPLLRGASFEHHPTKKGLRKKILSASHPGPRGRVNPFLPRTCGCGVVAVTTNYSPQALDGGQASLSLVHMPNLGPTEATEPWLVSLHGIPSVKLK